MKPVHQAKSDYAISLRQRAELAIAHGALTNSKRPASFVEGVYPTHLSHGRECYVFDTDGKRYIDFICGLGSNLLGYGDRRHIESVNNRLTKGGVLSLGTEFEVEYAERIKELFPVEKIRILKTGSEACSAAIRIARAFTGRPHIISEGYHGWADEFVTLTPPAVGVNPSTRIHELRHLGTAVFEREVAAVIIEPIITDYSPERIQFLRDLAARCKKHKMLLIFDETITGLRFPELSVARHTGVIPDLIILGKAIGGGMPISIVGGRADAMDADYFVSSTFAGDTVAMAASLETLRQVTSDRQVRDMWNRGEVFQKEFNSIEPEICRIKGYPMRGVLDGFEIGNALFMQEACKAGLLFGKSFFWNYHHDKEAHHVLNLCRGILTRIKHNEVALEGEMPKKAYAQRVRDNGNANN
jgi:glutamate-1-semialdehyde 2,1-aminomutase